MLAAALIAVPANATGQFDLICDGTRTDFQQRKSAWHAEMRIDLVKRRFCEDQCDAGTLSLRRVTPKSIVFLDKNWKIITQYAGVDRYTGRYDASLKTDDNASHTEALCHVASFKGFPPFEQKF